MRDINELVDPADLAAVVALQVNKPKVEISNLSISVITAGKGDGVILRANGVAHENDQSKTWSVIVKRYAKREILQPWHVENWQREIAVYKSDVIREFPAGAETPRCYSITENQESVSLWLEDVSDAYDGDWPLKAFGEAAYRLGTLNSNFIGRNLDQDWLARDVLAQWTSKIEPIKCLPRIRDNALLDTVFDQSQVSQILRIADNRQSYISTLAELPQTLCHMDAFRRNLFLRTSKSFPPRLVLIDWSHCGCGAVGEDLAALIGLSAFFFEADPRDLVSLEKLAFERYVEGLQALNSSVRKEQVWLAYTAANTLRLLSRTRFIIELALNTSSWVRWERVFGKPVEEILGRFSGMLPHMLLTANEYDRLIRRR